MRENRSPRSGQIRGTRQCGVGVLRGRAIMDIQSQESELGIGFEDGSIMTIRTGGPAGSAPRIVRSSIRPHWH